VFHFRVLSKPQPLNGLSVSILNTTLFPIEAAKGRGALDFGYRRR